MQRFEPHDMDWTPDRIKRFWDWYSQGVRDEDYFSFQVGDALLELVETHLSERRRVLDFGCGPGFLLEKLAKRGYTATGIDFSPKSVAEASERVAAYSSATAETIEGIPSRFHASAFDVVFLVETLEHLRPADRDAAMTEIHRLLSEGGSLILTVPNNEILSENQIQCPECGAQYHQVQHVSSWTARSSTQLLQRFGFEVRTVMEVDLFALAAPRPSRSERLATQLSNVYNAALGRRFGPRDDARRPNLILIASKDE